GIAVLFDGGEHVLNLRRVGGDGGVEAAAGAGGAAGVGDDAGREALFAFHVPEEDAVVFEEDVTALAVDLDARRQPLVGAGGGVARPGAPPPARGGPGGPFSPLGPVVRGRNKPPRAPPRPHHPREHAHVMDPLFHRPPPPVALPGPPPLGTVVIILR